MNTLHLCHWQGLEHFNQHLGLIDSSRDSLVIFGDVTDSELTEVEHQSSVRNIQWYLVNEHRQPYIDHHNIDHKQWLDLIISHHNSYAWK